MIELLSIIFDFIKLKNNNLLATFYIETQFFLNIIAERPKQRT